MDDQLPRFSDESSTGEFDQEFRGLGRATIAARLADKGEFEWFARFRRDYLPKGAEPKSAIVLPIIEASPTARDYLLNNIGTATIVIVDFGEHYRTLLTDVFSSFGHAPPTRRQAIDFVIKARQHRELARSILAMAREAALYGSAVPRVESLLRDVIARSGIPSGSDGILIDREALRELSDQSFHELVVRFSVAFADALAPDNQSAAITRILREHGMLVPGSMQVITLGSAVLGELVFDVGDAQAFTLLRSAHDQVVEQLEHARESYFMSTLRGASVAEQDSRQVLGLQAADVAARLAVNECQRYADDRTAGAHAVKQMFDRVLLNDRWILGVSNYRLQPMAACAIMSRRG